MISPPLEGYVHGIPLAHMVYTPCTLKRGSQGITIHTPTIMVVCTVLWTPWYSTCILPSNGYPSRVDHDLHTTDPTTHKSRDMGVEIMVGTSGSGGSRSMEGSSHPW